MNTRDIQVDSSLYTTAEYCLPGRFAAYAYQIREILNSWAKNVLEIGPGNGVATYTLRKAGVHVDTLDFDPALKPDYVASVLELPFAQKSYDAVLCCQVLEHLAWENFEKAVKSITNVVKKTIVISLPHISRYYYVTFQFPKIASRTISLDLAINRPMEFDGEHYWEIGKGVSEKDVLTVFEKLGVRVDRSYRIKEFRYHHMFSLSR